MADLQLQPTTFAPVQARRQELCHTIIEDAPQVSIRRAAPPLPNAKAAITSPMSDDFPTPRAVPNTASTMMTLCFPQEAPSSPASSDSQAHSDGSSVWSKRSSSTSFDSMYDLSSSEGEDVQIKLSSSVKKRVAHIRRRPSIAIPSPSQWPTAYKHIATPISPSMTLQLSPAILQRFDMQTLNVPAMSKAPSLAGSSASEELTASSCPSTPDLQTQSVDAWDAPIQLDPSAFSVLQQISGETEPEEAVIEVPIEISLEMREIVESPRRFGGLHVQTNELLPPPKIEDELSALSIPSPGNFFSSLSSAVARQAWSGNDAPTTTVATEFYGVPFKSNEAPALPTSTATAFYGLPWQTRPENTVEHTITIALPAEKADPDTARRVTSSPTDGVQEVDEIDENYHVALEENAAANIDRTQLWLSTQKAYLDTALGEESLVDSFKDVDGASPRTPDQVTPPESAISPNSKKSVRFADAAEPKKDVKTNSKSKRISPIHDGTFWEAFCHTKRSQRARDVFQHRQMRAEAEQVRRNSASTGHAGQLKGIFEIAAVDRPMISRPVSGFVNDGPEDEEKKAAILRAERERQALEQMQPSAWHVQAQKELNGGTLLTSPIVATFKQRRDVQILDLFGQAHCSWAWDVAVTHPCATVYTTVATDVEAHIAESSMDGPLNHCVVAAPKPWELPFEDDTFNVVSARNLYMHLRTQNPHGETSDEWDLTLQECMRVLKPGGYFEFDLLDAEMMHPKPAAQALGVEFAFNLKTRGYDPSSGKNFLPRLKRAGFKNIKRAWMILPLADSAPQWTDAGKNGGMRVLTPASSKSAAFPYTPEGYGPPLTGSTTDVRAITGLVGARSWEQWMLKVNAELGRSEARCLEGVGKALEESGKANAGWRCLVGWAQKDA